MWMWFAENWVSLDTGYKAGICIKHSTNQIIQATPNNLYLPLKVIIQSYSAFKAMGFTQYMYVCIPKCCLM